MVRVWWHVSHLSTFSRAVIKCYTNLMLTFLLYLLDYLLINQLVSHHCCVCCTRCLTLILLVAKMLLKQHVACLRCLMTNTVMRCMNFAGSGSKTAIAEMKILDVIIGMKVIVASEI